MKIVVVGATGATGSLIVEQLVSAGHKVVAGGRRPDAITAPDGVEKRKVDFTNLETMRALVRGCDVVVSAIGTGGLGASRKYTTLYTDATRSLRAAMREEQVKRIIVMSSGGVQEDDVAPGIYNSIIRRYIMNTYLDMARMEAILEESPDIEFTAVRLVQLVKGKEPKDYIVRDRVLQGGAYKISYLDAARFVAKEVSENKWVGKYPVISYA